MRDKEIKNLIKEAYQIEPLDQKNFIKKYQKRKMNIFDLLWQQAEHIGKVNALIGVIVLAAFITCIQGVEVLDVFALTRISALIPAIGVIALAGVNRSEKWGMDELEMAARFSLRSVKLARLLLVGIIDVIILGIAALAVKLEGSVRPVQAVLVVAVPYLATAWGCLAITRKIHSKMDIYACMGWAAVIAFLCGVSSEEVAWAGLVTGGMAICVLVVALVVMIGIEISKMVKGENIEWNLC